jgi:hypothetical protein
MRGATGARPKKIWLKSIMSDFVWEGRSGTEQHRQWGQQQRWKCGCRKCKAKHGMMFWTIVFLLLVIIALLMRQNKII